MKKVLMISYFFPPMGGVAVQRISKFCKFLPEFGWQPIVLTVKNGYWTVWDPSNQDYKTGHEIVYRTPFYSPFTLLNKLSFGKNNFGTTSEDKSKGIERPSWRKKLMRNISMLWCIPDEFISWFPFAYFYGLSIIKRHGIDLIYANDSPHTCSIIALVLSKATGIPFIVDFRDLWTGNPEFVPRNKLDRLFQIRLEKKVLESASKIIAATKAFVNVLATSITKNRQSKFEAIYNGFDPDDFTNNLSNEYFKEKSKFRIVYTGSFFGPYLSPKNILIGFSRFIGKFKLSPSDVEIIFAGSNSETLKSLISKLNLRLYINQLGNLSHSSACELQKSADLLLLIIYSNAGAEKRVSAKLFEYLIAERPILSIVPEGEVSEIIHKTGVGMVANPDDIDDIERCLAALYEKIHIKKEPFQRNEQEINKFNRRDQTKRLAEIFDEVVATNK